MWKPSARPLPILRRCLHEPAASADPECSRRAGLYLHRLFAQSSDYCLLIPVINEGSRILTELGRAQKAGVDRLVDIVICDGGSTDGSMNPDTLELYG